MTTTEPTPTTTAPVATTPVPEAAEERKRRAPQQFGKRRRQKSRYGTQMEEKQQLKGIYLVREEQLRNYFKEAQSAEMETGPTLISLLERRLDNALFRAGFSPTRAAARQMASHRLVTVNGRGVTIPSMRLRTGDTVSIREGKRTRPLFANFTKRLQNVNTPTWIKLNPDEFSFTLTALPDANEAGIGVDIRAIVEYFAR